MIATAEAIIEQEIVELANKYKTTPAGIRKLISDTLRDGIWKELGHMKHECLICGQIVDGRKDGRHRIGNTNFGRVSHGKKHLHDGTAYSVWGGVDGVFIMPSRARVEREIEKTIASRRAKTELPKLRAERLPLATKRRELIALAEKIEQALLKALRAFGSVAAEPPQFKARADDLAETHAEINKIRGELDAIEAKYDADVVGMLTMGEL